MICYTSLPLDNFFIGQETPLGLHMAAEQGDLQSVKSLVERGTDVNIKDDDGVCIWAAFRDIEDLYTYLLYKYIHTGNELWW